MKWLVAGRSGLGLVSLGRKKAAKLLEQTLLNERAADQLLSKLVEFKANLKAA